MVVRDSQGRVVGNLKQEDFHVFDNNKPQLISGFSIQNRAGKESPSGCSTCDSGPAGPCTGNTAEERKAVSTAKC